jgi:signal transduction histidine kinase
LILALQLAFCAAVYWTDTVSQHVDGRRITEVQVAGSAVASLNDTAFAPARLSGEMCCATPGAHVRAMLTADDTRHDAPAILLTSAHDNASVYVGGERVGGIGFMGQAPSNFAMRPLIVPIPRRLAIPGAQVDILVQRAVGVAHLRPFYIGEYRSLYPPFLALRAIHGDLLFMNAAFGAFLAGLAFCAAPLFRARTLLWSLAALGGSWTLQQVSLLTTDPSWGVVANSGLYYVAFLATLLSAIWFFIEWTSAFEPAPNGATFVRRFLEPWSERARHCLMAAMGVVMIVATGLIIRRLSYDLQGASHAINVWISWLGLFAMAFCLVRIVAYYARVGLKGPIEASSFIFVIVAAIADLVEVRFFNGSGALLGAAVTFFPLALLVSLAARSGGVFDAATANAEKLNALVTERETQIHASLAELQRRDRDSVLSEERSRIMRDMHDGIGGQLLGLILQARSNKLSHEKLVQGLEESLTDLRVIVDSLEQGEGSLATALGTFRARIETRCEAAGATLEWRIEDVVDAAAFGPDRALQLYRILQEACTNALTHGKPNKIAVTLARCTSGNIQLCLTDNGRGFDPAATSTGRGLANMRQRASRIGARLRVETSTAGTSVILDL